ncbi:L,D-transpeptidase [Streptomyces aurantiacus]|uniref:L,D-transpeptidase n=1 Tax=Streptomyces aurantiacus TaxID=47760 RepID=UPI0006E19433|nr:L,D-transpeptidase [Streptomyces aurantiacus]
MSDELTPGRWHGNLEGESGNAEGGSGAGSGSGVGFERSALAVALRELTQDHETPPTVSGSEIRRRAVRRRRRRKAALATAGTAGVGALALVLAVAFTGGEHGERSRSTRPAAGYGEPTPSVTAGPVPATVAATVDLGRRQLVAEGRTVPISSGTEKSPTATGLMTVTAKYRSAAVPADVAGWSTYDMKASWVMRLRGPGDRTNYLLSLDWDQKAPGSYDITGGAIGLQREDAMWLYEMLRPGAVVEVVGATPTRPADVSTPSLATPGRSTPERSTEEAATPTGAARATGAVGSDTRP